MKMRFVYGLTLACCAPLLAQAPVRHCWNSTYNSGACVISITPEIRTDKDGVRYVTEVVKWVDSSDVPLDQFGANAAHQRGYNLRFSDTENSTLTFIKQDHIGIEHDKEMTWKAPERPWVPGATGPPFLIQIEVCGNVNAGGIGYLGGVGSARSFCSPWDNVPINGLAEAGKPPAQPPAQLPPQQQQQRPQQQQMPQQQQQAQQRPGRGMFPPAALRPQEAQPAAGTCRQGFVWRQAFSNDRVCVTPQERAQAAADNRTSGQRTLPNGQCQRGFVWRQAGPQDHVCVTPQARAEAAQQNRQAAARMQP